jgi:hypothetical protein
MGDMTLMAFVGAALGPARAIRYRVRRCDDRRRRLPRDRLSDRHDAPWPRRGADRAPLGAEQQSLRLPLVPFGVFLAPAAAVMLIWGDRLLGRVFLAP